MEAPTLFYAVALVIGFSDPGNSAAVTTAWVYVLLRMLHSLVQALVNHIPTRLFLFVLSTIALAVLMWHAALAVIAK